MTVRLAAVTGTKPAFLLLEGRGPCAWRFVVEFSQWPQIGPNSGSFSIFIFLLVLKDLN